MHFYRFIDFFFIVRHVTAVVFFSRLGRSTSGKSSYDLQYAAIMPATMLHNAAAAILMKQCLYLSALSLISRR